MLFFTKLIYYCLLTFTTFLSFFYIYTAVFKRVAGENPPFMKESFGIASILVLILIYKAYQVGELGSKFTHGIYYLLSSWLVWGVVLLGYLGLAKLLGRF